MVIDDSDALSDGVYELQLKSKTASYKIKIDAMSGQIVKTKADSHLF